MRLGASGPHSTCQQLAHALPREYGFDTPRRIEKEPLICNRREAVSARGRGSGGRGRGRGRCTHVLVGRLVGGGEVRVEAGQPQHRPHGQEADGGGERGGGRGAQRGREPRAARRQRQVRHRAREHEHRQEGQRHHERVEVAVVAPPHAVADPRAVVVEPVHAVVAQRAVRGARRPEHAAREAVLELHGATAHEHLTRARRRALRPGCGGGGGGDGDGAGVAPRVALVRRRARDDAGVGQRRAQQRRQREGAERGADGGHCGRHARGEEGAVEREVQRARARDERQREREHAGVRRRHEAPVAPEAVAAREHLPLARHAPRRHRTIPPAARDRHLPLQPSWSTCLITHPIKETLN